MNEYYELQERSIDYKSILDRSFILIVTDKKGTITYVNEMFCNVSKYAKDEIIGNCYSILDANYHSKIFFTRMSKTLSLGKIWKGDVKFRAKDGDFFWMHTIITPSYSNKKKEVHYTALQFDITSKKQHEQNMSLKTIKIKEGILASVSHDLRTPLNTLVGYGDLLKGSKLDKIQNQYVDSMIYSADILINITNDLLSISKYRSGKIVLDSDKFNIRKSFKAIIDLFRPDTLKKGVELKFSASKNVPEFIVSDAARLEQMLINLISNAIKFTHRGEIKVYLSFFLKGDRPWLKIGVKDTGIGIAHEKVDSIFQSFTQADSSIQRKYGGTGLGLSIVNNLVKLFKGTVNINSKLNYGSDFIVELPIKIESGEQEKEKDLSIRKINYDALPSGIKVLLVEDNLSNQLLCKAFLERFKCLVTVVSNGKDYIDIVKDEEFDIIFTDIEIPFIDGYTATKIIRESVLVPITTPIIATTAHLDYHNRNSYFTDFLIKPYKEIQLFNKLLSNIKIGD